VNSGIEVGNSIVISAVESVLKSLDVDLKEIERIAVCGNPIQLSIFQGIEIRDLAYAGDAALERFGISRLERRAATLSAGKLKLNVVRDNTTICIPPSVAHMIGADAIAMIVKSGVLQQRDIAMVTDYGTNAEIGLKVGDEIYTGSAAAGPAIEGQQIEKGMLASPGAISDLNYVDSELVVTVLDDLMMGQPSYVLDVKTGEVSPKERFIQPKGITGTGTIALISCLLQNKIIKLPHIATEGKVIRLFRDDIFFTEKDLNEAGKAFGAFRAGHLTLVNHLGLTMNDIKSMYMAGAGGTYVDPIKAQNVGLVPPNVNDIYQVGNTSIAFALDIAINPDILDKAQEIAERLKKTHVMFPVETDFKNAYIAELGIWGGMPVEMYRKFLKRYKLPDYPEREVMPKIHKIVMRDIPFLGEKGLHIVKEIGTTMTQSFDGCTGCLSCEKACLEEALKVINDGSQFRVIIKTEFCNGVSCRKCQEACPNGVYEYSKLVVKH